MSDNLLIIVFQTDPFDKHPKKSGGGKIFNNYRWPKAMFLKKMILQKKMMSYINKVLCEKQEPF